MLKPASLSFILARLILVGALLQPEGAMAFQSGNPAVSPSPLYSQQAMAPRLAQAFVAAPRLAQLLRRQETIIYGTLAAATLGIVWFSYYNIRALERTPLEAAPAVSERWPQRLPNDSALNATIALAAGVVLDRIRTNEDRLQPEKRALIAEGERFVRERRWKIDADLGPVGGFSERSSSGGEIHFDRQTVAQSSLEQLMGMELHEWAHLAQETQKLDAGIHLRELSTSGMFDEMPNPRELKEYLAMMVQDEFLATQKQMDFERRLAKAQGLTLGDYYHQRSQRGSRVLVNRDSLYAKLFRGDQFNEEFFRMNLLLTYIAELNTNRRSLLIEAAMADQVPLANEALLRAWASDSTADIEKVYWANPGLEPWIRAWVNDPLLRDPDATRERPVYDVFLILIGGFISWALHRRWSRRPNSGTHFGTPGTYTSAWDDSHRALIRHWIDRPETWVAVFEGKNPVSLTRGNFGAEDRALIEKLHALEGWFSAQGRGRVRLVLLDGRAKVSETPQWGSSPYGLVSDANSQESLYAEAGLGDRQEPTIYMTREFFQDVALRQLQRVLLEECKHLADKQQGRREPEKADPWRDGHLSEVQSDLKDAGRLRGALVARIETLGFPGDSVRHDLAHWDLDHLRDAFGRAGNLDSSAYQQLFRDAWRRDPAAALDDLAKGLLQPVVVKPSRRSLALPKAPAMISAQVPDGVYDAFTWYPNNFSGTAWIEWSFVRLPDGQSVWLPTALLRGSRPGDATLLHSVFEQTPDGPLRVLSVQARNKGREQLLRSMKEARHARKPARVRHVRELTPRLWVIGRIPKDGSLTIGWESEAGSKGQKGQRGNYALSNPGEFYAASVGLDAVPLSIRLMSSGEEIPLVHLVRRDEEGYLLELLSSPQSLSEPMVRDFNRRYGHLWIEGLVVLSNLEVNAGRVTDPTTGFNWGRLFVVPEGYAGAAAEVLLGRDAAPVFLRVFGDSASGKSNYEQYLRRMEIRSENGAREEVVDSASGSFLVTPSGNSEWTVLTLAAARARARSAWLILRDLPLTGWSGRQIAVANRQIRVNVAIFRRLASVLPAEQFEKLKAEVLFDTTDPANLRPVWVGIGYYDHDDANQFRSRVFHRLYTVRVVDRPGREMLTTEELSSPAPALRLGKDAEADWQPTGQVERQRLGRSEGALRGPLAPALLFWILFRLIGGSSSGAAAPALYDRAA